MNDPVYREWMPGRFEKLLPAAIDDFDPVNRSARLSLFVANVQAGADRDICRGIPRSEEEFRAGCRMAGHEPGEGWLVRPAGAKAPSVHLREAEPVPVVQTLTRLGGEDMPW